MISRLHSSSAVSCCRTSRRSSARTRTFIGGLLPTQNISDLPDLISANHHTFEKSERSETMENEASDSAVQDAPVPLSTRCMGNCHWNRDTLRTILHTSFQTT